MAVALGVGMSPASATGSTDSVASSVSFHDPAPSAPDASWQGLVNGMADCAGDGVTFAVTSGSVAPGATVTITATADAAHVFPGGEKTRIFTHTFTSAGSGKRAGLG